jgi:molybdopterin-binding protein
MEGFLPILQTNKESIMKISARNVLKGRIKRLNVGVVNTEVVIDLGGGAEIVSIITKSSAEELSLQEGSDVYAVIKASDVMVAIGQ